MKKRREILGGSVVAGGRGKETMGKQKLKGDREAVKGVVAKSGGAARAVGLPW